MGEKQVTTLVDTTYFLYSALGNLVWSLLNEQTSQ
jgi:hypothetical protein